MSKSKEIPNKSETLQPLGQRRATLTRPHGALRVRSVHRKLPDRQGYIQKPGAVYNNLILFIARKWVLCLGASSRLWPLPVAGGSGLFVLVYFASRKLNLSTRDQMYCYLIASVVVSMVVGVDAVFVT